MNSEDGLDDQFTPRAGGRTGPVDQIGELWRCLARTTVNDGHGVLHHVRLAGRSLVRGTRQPRQPVGDVLGAAQSGRASSLQLLSLIDHGEVIAEARALAEQIVAADPDLREHPGLAEMVAATEATARTDYLDKA